MSSFSSSVSRPLTCTSCIGRASKLGVNSSLLWSFLPSLLAQPSVVLELTGLCNPHLYLDPKYSHGLRGKSRPSKYPDPSILLPQPLANPITHWPLSLLPSSPSSPCLILLTGSMFWAPRSVLNTDLISPSFPYTCLHCKKWQQISISSCSFSTFPTKSETSVEGIFMSFSSTHGRFLLGRQLRLSCMSDRLQ